VNQQPFTNKITNSVKKLTENNFRIPSQNLFLDSNAKPKYIGNKIDAYLGKLSGELEEKIRRS
jgi:hypothetical protein